MNIIDLSAARLRARLAAIAGREPRDERIRGMGLLDKPSRVVKVGGRTLGFGYRVAGRDTWRNEP